MHIVKSVENYKNGISADLFVSIGGILIDVVRCSTTSWNFWNISRNISWNISGQKFMKFYITKCDQHVNMFDVRQKIRS